VAMAEDSERARMVGINHVALSVGDAEEAREFYGSVFDFEVRGRTDSAVFLDMGDQFLALTEDATAGRTTDDHRHFGIVVDDADVVERRLEAQGVERIATAGLDFRDPWGNRLQVVQYDEVQFTKAAAVLDGMELDLDKTESAREELAEKGMAPE